LRIKRKSPESFLCYGHKQIWVNQTQGAWTQQTFTLSTGTNPTGAGNPLRLGFINVGTRGAEYWYGQVVIDSITFTDISQ
jgi:hypothetical protein